MVAKERVCFGIRGEGSMVVGKLCFVAQNYGISYVAVEKCGRNADVRSLLRQRAGDFLDFFYLFSE